MMTLPNSFIALMPDSDELEIVEIVRTRKTGIDDVLKSIAGSVVAKFPNLPLKGMMLSLRSNGTEVCLSAPLTAISISGSFVVIERDGKKIASLACSGEGPLAKVEMNVKWTPPDTMIPVFTASFSPSGIGYKMSKCYLIAKSSRKPENYLLPLPNLHPDANICMGSGWTPPQGADLVGMFESAVAHFQSSKWNLDLVKDSAMHRGMFSFEAGSMKQLTQEEWEACCTAVNPVIADMI